MDDEQPWDRAALAVSADHLTAAGDPRGELIALELEIEDYGTTIEIDARRRALLVEWVAGDADRLRRSYVAARADQDRRLVTTGLAGDDLGAEAEDKLLHATLFRRMRCPARLDPEALRAIARFEREHGALPPSVASWRGRHGIAGSCEAPQRAARRTGRRSGSCGSGRRWRCVRCSPRPGRRRPRPGG